MLQHVFQRTCIEYQPSLQELSAAWLMSSAHLGCRTTQDSASKARVAMLQGPADHWLRVGGGCGPVLPGRLLAGRRELRASSRRLQHDILC